MQILPPSPTVLARPPRQVAQSTSRVSRVATHESRRADSRLQQLTLQSAKQKNTASVATKQPARSPSAARKGDDCPPIRLLVADDHALILEGLAAAIGRQADMIVVAKAADGREAVALWNEHRPDVSLLDLRMPELGGVGAMREIRDRDVSARVIVHTTFDTDEDIYQAVRAGAKAYLLKDAPLEELLTCIRSVHAGSTCIPPALAAKLAARMSGEAMTAREVDVLKLLARGRSNKEIGSDLFVSETTVKSHVRNIFTKLNVMSRTEAIAAASHRGLIRL